MELVSFNVCLKPWIKTFIIIIIIIIIISDAVKGVCSAWLVKERVMVTPKIEQNIVGFRNRRFAGLTQ